MAISNFASQIGVDIHIGIPTYATYVLKIKAFSLEKFHQDTKDISTISTIDVLDFFWSVWLVLLFGTHALRAFRVLLEFKGSFKQRRSLV